MLLYLNKAMQILLTLSYSPSYIYIKNKVSAQGWYMSKCGGSMKRLCYANNIETFIFCY